MDIVSQSQQNSAEQNKTQQNSAGKQASRKRVTLQVDGWLLKVPQSVAHVISTHLVQRERNYDVGEDGSVVETLWERPLYERRGVITSTGHLARICDLLRQAGYPVRVQGLDAWAGYLRGCLMDPAADRDVVDALTAHPGGQIIVRPSETLMALERVTSAFAPRSRVLLIATNNERADLVANRLAPQVSYPVVRLPDRMHFGVMIGTSAEYNASRLHDVCVFDGTAGVVAKQNQEFYPLNRREPRYLVRAVGDDLDANAELLIEHHVGPVIAGPSSSVHPALVLWALAPQVHASARLSAIERKRQLIWNNHRRNQLIASIALAVLAGDVAALNQLRVTSSQIDESALREMISRRDVVILVETTKHAAALQRLLPRWPVFAHQPDPSIVSEEPEAPCIVTVTEASSWGLPGGILIRADGTGSPLAIQGLDRGYELRLIIDFDDDVDEQAVRDTRQRREDYTQLGWTMDTVISM